jgi:hypothetical protein
MQRTRLMCVISHVATWDVCLCDKWRFNHLQCSKWVSICRYTTLKLLLFLNFIPSRINISFFYFWRNILVSLLRGIPFIHSFTGAYSPGRTFGLPFRDFLITHIQTHGRTPLGEWSARRRGLYLHRKTQQTNIHAPSGIRTRDPSNKAAADLHLRWCGHYRYF